MAMFSWRREAKFEPWGRQTGSRECITGGFADNVFNDLNRNRL